EQLSSIAAYPVRGKLAEEPPGEAVKPGNKKETKRKLAWFQAGVLRFRIVKRITLLSASHGQKP
ncbi:MAG: hypothetical protein N2B57_08710, partial [Planctomycetales bacterium]